MTRNKLIARDPLDALDRQRDEQRRRLDQLRQTAAQHARVDYTQSPRERREKAARRRKISKGLSQCNYDLPASVADAIEDIAQAAKCPMSSVVSFLLVRGLAATTLEDLRDALVTTRSPRFEFVLRTVEAGEVENAKTAFLGA